MAYREERWAKCQEFIRRTRTLPQARALAAKEGFSADASVWINAWAKLITGGRGAKLTSLPSAGPLGPEEEP